VGFTDISRSIGLDFGHPWGKAFICYEGNQVADVNRGYKNLTSTRSVDGFGFQFLNFKQGIIMYNVNYVYMWKKRKNKSEGY